MNTYEFWNDMDKIFNAIVAYQEKTIEFNKRFITPWVNLGNVFDKQESNEEIAAHKNAIEIDPRNAHNWCELANTYARAGSFDKSIEAYQKAIELGSESGELYKNLALAHAMTGKHQDSIPIFKKGLTLLDKDEDKAIVWNHLGNVYRKLNDYEMALNAFQQADQFESVKPIVSEDQTEESIPPDDESNVSQATDNPAAVIDTLPDSEEVDSEEALATTNEAGLEVDQVEEQQHEETDKTLADEQVAEDENDDEDDDTMPVILELDYSINSSEAMQEDEAEDVEPGEEEVEEEFLDAAEKESDDVATAVYTSEEEVEPEEQDTQKDSSDAPTSSEKSSKPSKLIAFLQRNADVDQEDFNQEPTSGTMQENTDLGEDDADAEGEEQVGLVDVSVDDDLPVTEEAPLVAEQPEEVMLEESDDESELEKDDMTAEENNVTLVLSAYEEYLKDSNAAGNVDLTEIESENTQTIAMAPPEVEVTESEVNMEVNTDLTVDMDTKNAHVWNELGNVYFNSGSYDDAIAAYSKAIELDTRFAWPYTNLALSYVQKDRLEEAILLYQRSIELFSNENDKAVTWNRLGNVYRRLNDYENAISAYQRADELDPGNAAITQQSRFSLLGSDEINQEAGYSL